MSTLKLSLELEVTPGNEASLKDLLGCVAVMAANSCPNPNPNPAEPGIDIMPETETRSDADSNGGSESHQDPASKRTRTRSRSAKPATSPAEPEPETVSPSPEPTPDPNLNPVESEARQGGDPLPTYTQLPKQEKPKYTVEWVRRLLAEKVGKYRAECKQKLADLGAANVSSLDPEKYAEFVDFLNTLSV